MTQSTLCNVLEARDSQWWNIDMAYVCKMPPNFRGLRTATSNACALSALGDSSRHLLGGCRHRDMVKSYIEHHDEAGKLILEAITMGTIGNNVFITDPGRK